MEKTKNNRIENFTDLNAWKEGHRLVLKIYEITRKFPEDEKFGLTNQLRRAAVSVTSCIAEGFSRNSLKEKGQFYRTSLGSLMELQNQLLIAHDIEYINKEVFEKISGQTVVTRKLLYGLIKSAKDKQ